MTKAFLFDLDSTLLQMNQDEFLQAYFKAVGRFSMSLGYNPKDFMEIFNKGAYSIIKNNGDISNMDCFWNVIQKKYPEIEYLKNKFDEFYENEFSSLEYIIHRTDTPRKIIDYLKSKGYTLILATNPVFPYCCTKKRIQWAGLKPSDFSLITTYENSYYCKPNPKYFSEILEKENLKPEECIMVGNDVDDDFSGLLDGMGRFYITDYAINRMNKKIEVDSYTLEEFLTYLKTKY